MRHQTHNATSVAPVAWPQTAVAALLGFRRRYLSSYKPYWLYVTCYGFGSSRMFWQAVWVWANIWSQFSLPSRYLEVF